MKTTVKYICFISFWIILVSFPLFSILGIRTTSNESFVKQEKREITDLPAWNWRSENVKKYFSELESFFGDRLAFRDDLLRLNGKLMIQFGEYANNSNEVVIGKDGWLFLGNKYQRTIDQYRGLMQMNKGQEDFFLKYFENIRDYLKNQNIPFYIVIAPDKHSIYPEYLPSYLSRKGFTPSDQLMKINKSLEILDLRKLMIEQKKNSKLLLYYKTDSHWNDFGAYIAYKEIINHLNISLKVSPLALDETNFISKSTQSNRDLLLMLKGEQVYREVEVSIKEKLSNYALKLKRDNEWVDLNPNNAIEIMKQPIVLNKTKKGKVMVIGDSFSNSLTIYFNNTFGEMIYCHSLDNGRNNIASLIKTYKPDCVIFEVVERYIPQAVGIFIPLLAKPNEKSIDILCNERIKSESVFNQQIDNVTLLNDGIHFTSKGQDPYFTLPTMEFPNKSFKLKVDITTPEKTIFQVFYLTGTNSNYNEEQSVRKLVLDGRQQITIPINIELVSGKLRIDPGNVLGEYIIHKIEIYQ